MSILLALLVSGPAVEQPRPAPGLVGVRRIELAEAAAGQEHEVRISAGLTTTLLFHGAAIARDAVTFKERDRVRLSIMEDLLLLIPSERVVPGERLRLSVSFADGAVPASTTFMLVVHPALAERQVEVYRQGRPPESLRAEMEERNAQLRQCHETVEMLHAGQKEPEGLTGLLVTGRMDGAGVTVKDITRDIVQRTVGALRVTQARSFRSVARVAVELWLKPPEGAETWTAEGAMLRGRASEELTGLTVWQGASMSSGRARWVVVEADATEDVARSPFILKVWGEDGRHAVTLGNVTFP